MRDLRDLIVSTFTTLALCLPALAQQPTPSAMASASPPPSALNARETLRHEARQWAASQAGVAPEMIEIGALDARTDAPHCTTGFRFDYPFESRSTLRAQCSQPPRQFYLRISTERPKQRLVATRALASGAVIQPSDIALRPATAQSQGIEDPAQLVGRALKRPLEPGESPSPQDVEEVVQIVRTTGEQRAGQALDAAATRIDIIPRSRAPAGALAPRADMSAARLRRDVPSDRILLNDDLIDSRQTIVAKRNLMRGEIIDASMFQSVELDRRALPPDYLTSTQGLDQGEVITAVKAGEPLRSSHIRPSMLVKKGQQVVLTVALQGLEISVRVEAMEDAKLGDQVKLRNPDSGKTLAGVVTGRGAARAL